MMPRWLGLLLLFCPQSRDERLPEFEVASVKPIHLNARNGIDITVGPGGRMVITAASLRQLIAAAYGGLQLYQVAGPTWIESTYFDVEAKPPENDFGKEPTAVAMGRTVPLITMQRLRSLLIARFNLKTHFEARDRTVYELSVARNGPKLKAADPNATVSCRGGVRGAGSIEAKNCGMDWLADRMGRLVFQTDVIDHTGLTGLYDFEFAFAPSPWFASAAAGDADPPGAPSLFTAIGSLGLHLDAQKAPVQVLVVDHAEKLAAN